MPILQQIFQRFPMNRNRYGFNFCILAFIFFSLALPGFAQKSTLSVQCVDSSGKSIRDAKVYVINLNTDKDKDKKSDSRGEAKFEKLEAGFYRAYGRKEGYSPALYEFINLDGSDKSVTLQFEAGADKKLYFEDPALEQRAAQLMAQGVRAYEQKDYANAEKLYNQSLEIYPSNAQTLYFLAILNLQQAKFDQAQEIFKASAENAKVMRALPLEIPQGKQNPYEAIYNNIQTLQKQIPAMRAENALRQKNYDAAIAQYQEVIKNDPQNALNYGNLAIALANTSRFNEALAALEKAEQLQPGSAGSLKERISAMKQNAEIKKAQALMTEGDKLFDAGDAAGALKKYEEASSSLSEKQAPLSARLARAQAKLGQKEAAVASFKMAIELAPENEVQNYRNALVNFHLERKEFEEAIDVLADPKTAGSKSPEQTLMDVAEEWKNQSPALATAALERVLKINSENADAYYSLGELSYIEGKEQDSRTKELLTKYVEIGKDPVKLENAKNMLVVVSKRSE